MDEVNYITIGNLKLYHLSQYVEYKIKKEEIMFYNSLYDSVLFAGLKGEEEARYFVDELRKGVVDIQVLINKCFGINPEEVYKVLVHKKMIE